MRDIKRIGKLVAIAVSLLLTTGCQVFEDGSWKAPNLRGCIKGMDCNGPEIEFIQEDDERWDCTLDGNQECGPLVRWP